MNHLEVEFVHLKCKLDSLNLFLEDADQLSQMLHRSAESEQEIMIPLGTYAFIPGKVHPQTNFMISLGAGIWIKMNLEESLKYVAGKKKSFQSEITRITTRMNEISQALERIENSGSCLNACGNGIFEIQEQFHHHHNHEIKDIPLASENERNELKLKLYQQKPVELSESQKKDMQKLEELIQNLEIEEESNDGQSENIQQTVPSSKPLKKVSFNQTVSFLREGQQIGEEPLKDFEKSNGDKMHFKPMNLSANENITLKSGESKSGESKSSDSKSIESNSNAFSNSQNSVQSPISNSSFPKKSPISLVVKERTRTPPEDSTIDEDQEEASILMKQIKSEYVTMKNRRAIREQSREFYTSPSAAQESSSGPARRSRFSKEEDSNAFQANNQLSDHVFDYVIQGTGLFESILACALSKAGKQVLQLESSTFYGGKSEGTPWNEEQLIQCGILSEPLKNETILSKLKFDLGVKFLNAHCPLGQLMVESRIAAHLDFKAIDSLLYYCPVAKDFLELPLTKEQIFLSKNLSLVEKRNTMAFLRELSQSSFSSPLEVGFRESLSKLPSHLQDALSICIPHQSSEELKEFIRSCGIFSSCPYLYSMFGSVEIAQSFVRLAAVNGAIQMLNAPSLDFHFEASEDASSAYFKCMTSHENSQLFTSSKRIITKTESKEQIHRAIAFAHEPILSANSKAILAFKKIKNAKLTIFQCDHSSMLCPEGLYFHFFECEVDFQSELQEMLQGKNVHFQFAFRVSKESIFDFHQNSLEPLRLESGTNFSHYFQAAQKAFHSIEPELEFFPNEPSQFHDSE